MKDIILEKLAGIEKDNNVKILYACESGSRAWGFASPDSDYDVRFIYIRTPEYYLSIDDPSDIIDLPVNEVLDISGWDIRKALKLFRKSNPPLLEWLQSPVVYRRHERFHNEMSMLATEYFLPRACYNHYLNMAVNAFEGDLSGELVKIKKYFYALRPILACLWTINKATLPPMEFEKLRVIITDAFIQQQIDALVARKAQANEKQAISSIQPLQDFLAETIEYCRRNEDKTQVKKNESDVLNYLFRKYLDASWEL
ncbi:MAG TPA: nucleotidyltransferase domain-containing protein [Bacteroidia bacterium]|nr:nucleotidyltransferase domain-containing protein [Bacteroidia bacterium]